MNICHLPPSLLEFLSNDLIFFSTLPHLSLSALIRLSRTSKSFQRLILRTPRVFQYLDLSECKGAYIPPALLTPIDSGGQNFRSQRMDENLTEDEFYSGPLRGVMSRISRMDVMKDVKVLILDGLASVTVDFISEIVTSDRYDVRMLSVLGCVNLNQRKLQQLLVYLCRPGRPEGSPRLRGLYVLGAQDKKTWDKGNLVQALVSGGILSTIGAQLGSLPTPSSSKTKYDIGSWYGPTGRVVGEGYGRPSSWQETLAVCKGIIAFDAVLCESMHLAMQPYLHEASKDYLAQNNAGALPIASVALGPDGCAGCRTAPKGSPTWLENDIWDFPLLRPVPWSGRVEDAVRPPRNCEREGKRRLIVSCTWCLANRHCESCHRWWCGECYDPKQSKKLSDLERLSSAGLDYLPSRTELGVAGGNLSRIREGESIKVFNGLCVENCLVGEMMSGAGSGGMWG